MANDKFEKEFEDEVYEDEYYDEHYDEEELEDDAELVEEDEVDDEVDDDKKIHLSFACEDCDYRWDDIILKDKDIEDEEIDIEVICPMCGSVNITQI